MLQDGLAENPLLHDESVPRFYHKGTDTIYIFPERIHSDAQLMKFTLMKLSNQGSNQLLVIRWMTSLEISFILVSILVVMELSREAWQRDFERTVPVVSILVVMELSRED